jgi:poly-gamma-glutamate capsule biosynthesis protein CapA/YwtB (metallophosphatase superfamily)
MDDDQPGSNPVTISLVGDTMFRSRLAPSLFEHGSDFHAVQAALDADLVIANLEMPLSRRGYRVPKWTNLRSDPELIDDVRAMGIDAVSLANNHMMDYGPAAMFDTLAACDAARIPYCGAGQDVDRAFRPCWLSAGNRNVALISVACTLPVESDAGPEKPGIAPLRIGFSFDVDVTLLAEQPGTVPEVRSWARPEDLARLFDEIANARREADLVIVAIHWGVPAYWLSPSHGLLAQYQQPVGRALIDAGADVVCGHHSHSLHPIEVYRGKPIFYSLGNFLFDDLKEFMEPESIIVRLTMGTELGVDLVPMMVDGPGLPRLAAGDEVERVLAKLETMSRPFGTRLTRQGGRGELALA